MLVESYNLWIVLSSLLISMFASYTALDMAGRVSQANGAAASRWLLGGSVAMGIGIWSMHFLGMLALNLHHAHGLRPDYHVVVPCACHRIVSSCPVDRVRRKTLLVATKRRRRFNGLRHWCHALYRHGGDAHASGDPLHSGSCCAFFRYRCHRFGRRPLDCLSFAPAYFEEAHSSGRSHTDGACGRGHALHGHGRSAVPETWSVRHRGKRSLSNRDGAADHSVRIGRSVFGPHHFHA